VSFKKKFIDPRKENTTGRLPGVRPCSGSGRRSEQNARPARFFGRCSKQDACPTRFIGRCPKQDARPARFFGRCYKKTPALPGLARGYLKKAGWVTTRPCLWSCWHFNARVARKAQISIWLANQHTTEKNSGRKRMRSGQPNPMQARYTLKEEISSPLMSSIWHPRAIFGQQIAGNTRGVINKTLLVGAQSFWVLNRPFPFKPVFEWPRAKPPAGGPFQNGTAPSAMAFRACYRKSKTFSGVSGTR
jgi:hypothetical protein